MKSTDSANATARALDLLPQGDPAASDPRLLRAPHLIEEARLTRETAAEVWLAVSPLHVAPPEVLQAIMTEIAPQTSTRKPGNREFLIGIAAAGWAAAAVLLVCLWPQSDARRDPDISHSHPVPQETLSESQAPPDSSSVARSSHDSRLRKEIVRLQTRLAEANAGSKPGIARVIALHPPGASARSPEDSQRRIQFILTNALRAALEAESGAPSDPASLVIDRGWPAGGPPIPDDGGMVRHRNFPEQSWKELGLLRSEDGSYYDASSSMIWTPDPFGSGFIGRKRNDTDNLAGFHAGDKGATTTPIPKPRTQPEGFIVENPAEHNVEVVIDQVPPPVEGSGHVIVLTDSSGNVETIPVTPAPEEESQIAGNCGLAGGTTTIPTGLFQNLGSTSFVSTNSAGTLIFTIPSGAGLGSFQLVERPLVPNGQPDRVIVEGQP